MKKLLASLLTTVLMLSVLAVPSMANYYDEQKYYVNEKDYLLYTVSSFSGTNVGEHYYGLTPPDEMAMIISGASKNFKSSVKEIVIPEKINGETIENVVFKDYTFLNRVVLPDSVKRFVCISFVVDEDYEYIPKREKNPLKSLHLGKGFLREGFNVSKTERGRLENLKTITVSEDNPKINMHNGAVYTENFKTLLYCPPKLKSNKFYLHKNARIISEGAFAYNRYIKNIKRFKQIERINIESFRNTKSLEKLVLGKKIKKIPFWAFWGSSIKRIKNSENIEKLEHSAFGKSKIEKFVFGNKIKTIEMNAFEKTKNLKKVVFGKNIKRICMDAFFKSGVEEIVINGKVNLEDNAFSQSSLKKVTVNEKIKINWANPFYRLEHVDFYAKNESIANHIQKLFSRPLEKADIKTLNIYIGKKLYCSIETKIDKLVIDDVETIEFCQYDYVDVNELVVGGKVKTIEAHAFYGSYIKKATIGESVETIWSDAFSFSDLEEIEINGNTKIHEMVFSNSKLKKVTLNGKIKIKGEYSPFVGCGNIEFYAKNKEIADDLYSQLTDIDFENGKIFVGNELLYTISPKK